MLLVTVDVLVSGSVGVDDKQASASLFRLVFAALVIILRDLGGGGACHCLAFLVSVGVG